MGNTPSVALEGFPEPGADLSLEQPVHAGGFAGVDLGLDLLRPAGDAGVREAGLHRHGRRRELLYRQGCTGGAGVPYGRVATWSSERRGT
jgi:hypothetical protein